jgi:hypothetical protein
MKSWLSALASLLGLSLPACVPSATPERSSEHSEAPLRATVRELVAIEVLSVKDDTPRGGDGAPRSSLAFRFADGTRTPITEEAIAYVPFRDGVALVDVQRRLLLISAQGDRRVLARASGAPPALGPRGELVYVARHDLVAEVHVLEATGRDRIVASGLASAGVLAPQPDGRLCFVGNRSGGVAGVYVVENDRARCLTNCELKTGEPWGDGYVPLPEDASSLVIRDDVLHWNATGGGRRSVALAPALPVGDVTQPPDALGGGP